MPFTVSLSVSDLQTFSTTLLETFDSSSYANSTDCKIAVMNFLKDRLCDPPNPVSLHKDFLVIQALFWDLNTEQLEIRKEMSRHLIYTINISGDKKEMQPDIETFPLGVSASTTTKVHKFFNSVFGSYEKIITKDNVYKENYYDPILIACLNSHHFIDVKCKCACLMLQTTYTIARE